MTLRNSFRARRKWFTRAIKTSEPWFRVVIRGKFPPRRRDSYVRRSRGFRICIAAENLKFMVPVGRRWYLYPEVLCRERETPSLLPVLVYFEGAVQLRNIHIPAGVSRLAGQEGVVERNGQPAVHIKRKKRASRWSELSMQDGQLRVWICWMCTNVKLNAGWLRRKCNIQSRSNLEEKSCKEIKIQSF